MLGGMTATPVPPTPLQLPRPAAGDVVELILADHELFEQLLRLCRRSDVDRDAARLVLAELLVAHGEAEEAEVYPKLRAKRAISEHTTEHGHEEHAEINEALLAFLDAKGTGTAKYDDAVEKLSAMVSHHSVEEELTILNPARTDVKQSERQELGQAWAAKRNQLLDEGCASREQVAALLEGAADDGTLAPEPAREQAEQIKEAAKKRSEELLDDAKNKG